LLIRGCQYKEKEGKQYGMGKAPMKGGYLMIGVTVQQ